MRKRENSIMKGDKKRGKEYKGEGKEEKGRERIENVERGREENEKEIL